MTEEQLQKLLHDIWDHKLSVDEAWKIIDDEREMPDYYSKEYWLPIINNA